MSPLTRDLQNRGLHEELPGSPDVLTDPVQERLMIINEKFRNTEFAK